MRLVVVSEFTDAASATYSSGTTPGQAPAWYAELQLYQHTDRLSTRATTDNQGQSASKEGHYPFGDSWYATGTADPSVPRKFTNYRAETEASSGQLNYAIFREHSARLGRFQMADPVRGKIKNPQRLNRYAYVRNDPANKKDPRGLAPCGDDDSMNPCPDLYEGEMGTCLSAG